MVTASASLAAGLLVTKLGGEKNMTHKEFLADNNASKRFKRACDRAGILVTTRQASKWRRKKGQAWKQSKKLV